MATHNTDMLAISAVLAVSFSRSSHNSHTVGCKLFQAFKYLNALNKKQKNEFGFLF